MYKQYREGTIVKVKFINADGIIEVLDASITSSSNNKHNAVCQYGKCVLYPDVCCDDNGAVYEVLEVNNRSVKPIDPSNLFFQLLMKSCNHYGYFYTDDEADAVASAY